MQLYETHDKINWQKQCFQSIVIHLLNGDALGACLIIVNFKYSHAAIEINEIQVPFYIFKKKQKEITQY